MFETWRAHFEANRSRPLPEVEAPTLPEHQRAPLARSMSVFQLGETGEGRIAKQIDSVELPLVDDDYRASLKMFIAEEGRHSRVLALMVKALGGQLLHHSWTHHLFVFARGLVGVRFKLLVLLAAEVIAIGFYGVLARVLPPGPMAAALRQICGDERAHFDFHCDFLRGQPAVFRWLWRPIGYAAAITVLFDHRVTLAAFGVPLSAAARELFGFVEEAARGMAEGAAPANVAAEQQYRSPA
ncbi:MAG: hypothetical protein JNK82_26935 [Myxococcaceae bacterium]|nr:hypothetical protein [Myxococcaceae bacterium]